MKAKDGSAVVARTGQGSTRWILAVSLCWGALSCSKDDLQGEEPFAASEAEGESQSHEDAEFATEAGSANDSSGETLGSLTEKAPTEPGAQDSLEKTMASLSTSDSPSEALPSSVPEAMDAGKSEKTPPRKNRVKGAALVGSKLLNGSESVPSATYVVSGGDSLTKIAKKIFGHTKHWEEVAALNDLAPPYTIYPGQGLRFPLTTPEAKSFAEGYRKNQKTVTVQKGDSLSKLAAKVFGNQDAWRRLFNYNKDKILDPNRLPAGITLAYFDGTSDSTAAEKPAAQPQGEATTLPAATAPQPAAPQPAAPQPAAAQPAAAQPEAQAAPTPQAKKALKAKAAPPMKASKKTKSAQSPSTKDTEKTGKPNIKISPNDLNSP